MLPEDLSKNNYKFYLFVDRVCLLLIPFKFKYRYFGLLKIAEILGGFAGLMKIKFHEYSKDR
jgi:hypothetical protein